MTVLVGVGGEPVGDGVGGLVDSGDEDATVVAAANDEAYSPNHRLHLKQRGAFVSVDSTKRTDSLILFVAACKRGRLKMPYFIMDRL